MELKNDHEEQQPSSVFQGDEFLISRILAREVSKGQSSSSFYGAAEGVPFEWETNPGTPKHPQEEDQIFPLCPSPLMQSLGLSLPNLEDRDHEAKEPALKTSIISSLRKLVKNNVIGDISKKVEKLGSWRCKQQGSSMFGDSKREGSAKGSSFSSNSAPSTFSSSSRVLGTPSVDDPFCCEPSDIHAILDEMKTTIHFCSHHKTAIAIEEHYSLPSIIKSRLSTSDKFSGPFHSEQTPAGIPFMWERQPGTPKTAPEDEPIPTPSPPPALALPRNGGGEEAKENSKKSQESWRVSKMNNLSCSPWSGTRFVVLAKKKFKSYIC